MSALGSLAGGVNTGLQQNRQNLLQTAQLELQRREVEAKLNAPQSAEERAATLAQREFIANKLGAPVEAVPSRAREATRFFQAGISGESAVTRREQGAARIKLRRAEMAGISQRFTKNLALSRDRLTDQQTRTGLAQRGFDVRALDAQLDTVDQLFKMLDAPERFPGRIGALWRKLTGSPLPADALTRRGAEDLQRQLTEQTDAILSELQTTGVPAARGGRGRRPSQRPGAPQQQQPQGGASEQTQENLKFFEGR